ncbi:hypothetical protein BDK51DRAFT_26178 [Blyttiomyces helicus]|uniref:Uncharacterized protein n=1 Tax=Blyttiomyces helicus TaxID=388810 RepID=A0A4P9WI79_9FUNG|nr:hypothetical protein BDK51DRAFT_26178 [Blyttiomyces helicus]|eukprot:RKO92561.1 hypothetical protein BDK51DRAFT_26178 [Blyttiomyces helicus]
MYHNYDRFQQLRANSTIQTSMNSRDVFFDGPVAETVKKIASLPTNSFGRLKTFLGMEWPLRKPWGRWRASILCGELGAERYSNHAYESTYPTINLMNWLISRGASNYRILDNIVVECAAISIGTRMYYAYPPVFLGGTLVDQSLFEELFKPGRRFHFEFLHSSAVYTSHDVKGNHMHGIPSAIHILETANIVAHHKPAPTNDATYYRTRDEC